jgi:hypothetical protein
VARLIKPDYYALSFACVTTMELDKTSYREIIFSTVNNYPGITSAKLSLCVMGIINPCRWNSGDYTEALDGLVVDRELIEVNYILPNCALNSIYFPKGTRIGKEFIP